MAGTSNYRLLIEAQLDPSKIEAQIKALSGKSLFIIKTQFDQSDFRKFEGELIKIKALGNTVTKITLFGDTEGGINKAVVDYTDQLGNAVKETIAINEEVAVTQTYTQNLAKDEAAINKLLEQQAALQAKQADEMARAALNADKFLEKSKNMASTPSVQAAVKTAEEIKVAVSEGDLGKVRELNDLLAVQKAALTTSAQGWQSWASGIRNAIKQTIEYGLSVGLVFGALQQLKDGIQYVADLNKELVKIQLLQVEGAKTNDQIADLSVQYNKLAKSMGATTIEVAQGSVEWLRQGRSIQETQELLKSTLMLSKLGELDTAQATELLTATLNGFNIEASKSEEVVSKFIAIDNIAATSAGELATALQYTSAVANQTGVTFDQLTAMVATVSSTTRMSAETIGQAFKTIFTRMEQVKAGAIDETGMSLNNVEKTLSSVGISLRDTTNSFRPLGEVLNDISEKWDTLDELQKAQIANAIAGVRQGQIFLTLMQNYGDVQKYMAAETNSNGLAQQRYAIYLQGVEAAQNKAKASWEALWQATIKSNSIKFFYDFSATILDLITKLGGLQTVLVAITAALIIQNSAWVATSLSMMHMNIETFISFFVLLVAQIKNGTAAMWLLNAAMDLNPIGILIAGLTVAIGLFAVFNKSVDDLIQKASDLEAEFTDIATNLKDLGDQKNQLSDLYNQFDKLRNITNKTSDEQQKFYDVQNQIKQILPEVNGYYDEQGRFILDQKTNLQELIDLKNKEIELEQKKLALKAKESIQAELDVYKKLTNEIRAVNSNRVQIPYQAKADIIEKDRVALEQSTLHIQEYFTSLSDEQKKVFLEAAKGTKIYDLLTQSIIDSRNAMATIPSGNLPTTSFAISPDEAMRKLRDQLKDVHDMVVNMIKQEKKAEEDSIRDQLNAFKELIDQKKKYYQDQFDNEKKLIDQKRTANEREHEDVGRNIDQQENALKQELDSYNDIIDAQINLLKEKQKETEYDRKKSENQDALAKLENQIAILSLDNSKEGIAEKLRLEEQASKLKTQMSYDSQDEQERLQEQALTDEKTAAQQKIDLRMQELEAERKASDEEYQLRQRALDDAEAKAQEKYDLRIRELDDEYAAQEKFYNDQIDQIENYLSQEGIINNDAMNMIMDKNSNVYQELLDWNKLYGTGINEDIVTAWDQAMQAVENYKNSLSTIPTTTSGTFTQMDIFHGHHSGVDSGFVGTKSMLSSNEEFAKLMKGELVINPSQMDRFMTKTLPSITKNLNEGGINIEMPLQVMGSLDKSVLPSVEKLLNDAVKRLNDNLFNRGFTRRAEQFGN